MIEKEDSSNRGTEKPKRVLSCPEIGWQQKAVFIMAKKPKQFKRYTERFKRHVVTEVLSGQMSVNAVSRKYGINGAMTVHKWCVKYGGEHYLSGRYIDLPLEQSKNESMSKKAKAPLSSDPKELQARIAQLETQLDAEMLKREALELAIEIMKRDHGIDVLKKLDTKQSRS